jgi:hypothetical protein
VALVTQFYVVRLGDNIMRRIVLISCVSKKLSEKSKARDIYISPLFKLNLAYAKSLNPYAIFILSAKYGLLDLDTKIAPYNITLNNMSTNQRKTWAQGVVRQLGSCTDLQKDHFIFLAGQNYRKYLTPHIASCEIPLEGLPIGKQLQHLKRVIDE